MAHHAGRSEGERSARGDHPTRETTISLIRGRARRRRHRRGRRAHADVAVSGGRIDEVAEPGRARGAREVLDADGMLVTPGFVDIHTHYDGQVTWDTPRAVLVARRDHRRDGQLRRGLRAGPARPTRS